MPTPEQVKDRERLRRYIEREGLTSVMSDAKWRRLRAAVTSLPFAITFRRRDVRDLGSLTSRWDSDVSYVFGQTVAIEWLELNARRESRRERLMTPVIHDDTAALRRALSAAHVPFSIVEDNVRVWGYLRAGCSPQWVLVE